MYFAAKTALKQFHSSFTEEISLIEPLATFWWLFVSANFFDTYYETLKGSDILPPEKEEVNYLIIFFLLEKMFQELNAGIKNEKEWVDIPVEGLKYLSQKLNLLNEFQIKT